jgi:hypothetical protein
MSEGTQPAMTGGMAAVATLVIVALVVGFVVLGSLLGLVPLYTGLLLLWYWGSIDELDAKALVPLVVGACGGTATAALLHYAAPWGGGAVAAVLGLIVAAIYCQLRGWLPLLINRPYMLYLTVMCAPLLQAGESFAQVFGAMAAGTVYFGGVILGGRFVAQRLMAGRSG